MMKSLFITLLLISAACYADTASYENITKETEEKIFILNQQKMQLETYYNNEKDPAKKESIKSYLAVINWKKEEFQKGVNWGKRSTGQKSRIELETTPPKDCVSPCHLKITVKGDEAFLKKVKYYKYTIDKKEIVSVSPTLEVTVTHTQNSLSMGIDPSPTNYVKYIKLSEVEVLAYVSPEESASSQQRMQFEAKISKLENDLILDSVNSYGRLFLFAASSKEINAVIDDKPIIFKKLEGEPENSKLLAADVPYDLKGKMALLRIGDTKYNVNVLAGAQNKNYRNVIENFFDQLIQLRSYQIKKSDKLDAFSDKMNALSGKNVQTMDDSLLELKNLRDKILKKSESDLNRIATLIENETEDGRTSFNFISYSKMSSENKLISYYIDLKMKALDKIMKKNASLFM